MTAGDLVHLIQKAAEARRTERTAFAEYGGYSWGYFGSELIETAEKAEQDLQSALNEFVDERVTHALKLCPPQQQLHQPREK